MKTFFSCLSLAVIIFALTSCKDTSLSGQGQEGKKKTEFISIGTGSATGVYYPAGSAIAALVNQNTDGHGINASATNTKGSVANINQLLSGALQFGIAQSDAQFNAVKGLGEWKDKPQDKIRFVFSLHPEAVTLVAAADAGIETLDDLKGKRVNLGEPGSGTRNNALEVLKTAGIALEDLKAEGLSAKESPRFIQDNRIDAFFYTVGHPAGAIEQATSGKRALKFISITGMDALLKKYPYFREATIDVSGYPRAKGESAKTFGFITTLVSSTDVSDDVVYNLVKAVFENLDTYKSKHPALKNLDPSNMVEGGTAPLHPGAERYFKEAGLIK